MPPVIQLRHRCLRLLQLSPACMQTFRRCAHGTLLSDYQYRFLNRYAPCDHFPERLIKTALHPGGMQGGNPPDRLHEKSSATGPHQGTNPPPSIYVFRLFRTMKAIAVVVTGSLKKTAQENGIWPHCISVLGDNHNLQNSSSPISSKQYLRPIKKQTPPSYLIDFTQLSY